MNPGLVVKLRPAGPWRIGPDSGARNKVDAIYHSDSLYAAVTSAMARLGSLDGWLDATARSATPDVCFSSCFPFLDEIGFVPPPRTVWPPSSPASMGGRVRWKSARFVPLGIVQAVLAGQRLDDNQWTVDGASECLVPAGRQGPFRTGLRWNAAVDRMTGSTERHSTACVEFQAGAGLWTVVSFRDEAARDRWIAPVQAAFRWLADSGFGGERSRGWGRSEPPEFVEGTLPEMILGAGAQERAGAKSQEQPAAVDAGSVSGAPAPEKAQEPSPVPPVEEPPAGEPSPVPPVEEPPSEEPPVTPPAQEPPVTEPPAEEASQRHIGDIAAMPAYLAAAEEVSQRYVGDIAEAPVAPPAEEAPVSEPLAEEVSQRYVGDIAEAPVAPPAEELAATEPLAEEVSQRYVGDIAEAPVTPPAEEPPATEPPAEEASQRHTPDIAGTPRSTAPDQPHWLLSLFTPAADDRVDWARGNYILLTRSGRVDASGELKKQLPMVAEGSVVYAPAAPRGSAPDVAPDGFAHPVFRAGFALSIPLPEVSG